MWEKKIIEPIDMLHFLGVLYANTAVGYKILGLYKPSLKQTLHNQSWPNAPLSQGLCLITKWYCRKVMVVVRCTSGIKRLEYRAYQWQKCS